MRMLSFPGTTLRFIVKNNCNRICYLRYAIWCCQNILYRICKIMRSSTGKLICHRCSCTRTIINIRCQPGNISSFWQPQRNLTVLIINFPNNILF